MERKRQNLFKKPTGKSVMHIANTSYEAVAMLLEAYDKLVESADFCRGELTAEDIPELIEILDNTFSSFEFDKLFETEFGKGYLVGMLAATVSFMGYEMADNEEESD